MSLSLSYLEEIYDSKELTSDVKQILKIFLAAVNDWPYDIKSLLDYENAVYELIGKEIDKYQLEKYLKEIDYSKNAWEAESLSQILEVYDYYAETKSLREILRELQSEIHLRL